MPSSGFGMTWPAGGTMTHLLGLVAGIDWHDARISREVKRADAVAD